MNKQELIDEIKRIHASAIGRRHVSTHPLYSDGVADTCSDVIKLLEQLDEPQKPIVPKFVADWFEEHKDDLEWSIWKLTIDSNANYTKDKKEMRHWIQYAPNKPYKTLIGMLNGYEVEKEQLYVMPVPHISFPVHYCVEDDHISFRQGNAQKFTQAELDKYFPDIKQFAVPVNEVEG
ncbi:hypothetical protein K5E_25400 [Enterococcus thailandicus]|uniref:DUF1642 domain-containing protein n=1 Tax=Enterococcus thailandicus TaxID=417368 RepID=UPI00244D894B|nr:DUF1642 domain-containing protein [Enterococcus thailandicus]GMC10401.1 hypothetical protein K5E_25400 [Enterococcus thailandicus]